MIFILFYSALQKVITEETFLSSKFVVAVKMRSLTFDPLPFISPEIPLSSFSLFFFFFFLSPLFDEIQFVLTSIMNVLLLFSLFVPFHLHLLLRIFQDFEAPLLLSTNRLCSTVRRGTPPPALHPAPPSMPLSLLASFFSSDFSIKNHLSIVQLRGGWMNLFFSFERTSSSSSRNGLNHQNLSLRVRFSKACQFLTIMAPLKSDCIKFQHFMHFK